MNNGFIMKYLLIFRRLLSYFLEYLNNLTVSLKISLTIFNNFLKINYELTGLRVKSKRDFQFRR